MMDEVFGESIVDSDLWDFLREQPPEMVDLIQNMGQMDDPSEEEVLHAVMTTDEVSIAQFRTAMKDLREAYGWCDEHGIDRVGSTCPVCESEYHP